MHTFSITYIRCKQWTNGEFTALVLRTVGKLTSQKTYLRDLLTKLNKIALLKFRLYMFVYVGMIGLGGGRWLPSINFWLSKRASNQMSSIRSKVYTTTRSTKILYAVGITYNPCQWILGDCVHPLDVVIWFLDYWLQTGYLTISIECVLGKEDVRERE